MAPKSPSGMTVAVLKKELKKRGLEQDGLKAALVERLQKALDEEAGGAAPAEAAAEPEPPAPAPEEPAPEEPAPEEPAPEEPAPEEPAPEEPAPEEPAPEPEEAPAPDAPEPSEPPASDAPEPPEPAAAAAPDVEAMMRKAQAMADKAVADHAAASASRKRSRSPEEDDPREDAKRVEGGADEPQSGAGDGGDGGLLPPDAFQQQQQPAKPASAWPSVGGGAPSDGPLVVVTGTGGHEGRIIGRGGAMIRELQDRHQVRIQIKRPEGCTEVTGAGAEACAAEIRQIMANAGAAGAGGGGAPPQQPSDPSHVTETIACDGVESRIIGKGGQNIRALMHRTGAQVRVISAEHKCIITGTPQCVAAAAADVNGQIQQFHLTGSTGGGPGGGGQQAAQYGGGYAAAPGGYAQAGGYAQPQQQQYGGYAQPQQYGGYAQPQQGYGGVDYGQAQQGGYQQPAAQQWGEPAPTGAAGLPPGWTELSSGGQVYYWNQETNVTQYERPQ